jgi:putative nucleotidyltransferase with HDIG domain
MIDLDYAIKEFNNYVSNYNLKDSKIKLKYKHTLRVMELSIEIAKSLNLSEEDIKLAGLIGLLHDIGRFDQAAKYNSFNDHKTINHGEYGANILFKEDLIRKFIIDDTYDEIIKKSVYAHNRDEIPESYNEHEMLHARIIRDADKLDIFYLLSSKEIYFKAC